MDQDTEPRRAPFGLDLSLESALVLGAVLSLVVLIGLALAAWVEHAA